MALKKPCLGAGFLEIYLVLLWPDPWGWRPSHLAGRQCVSISDRFLVGLPGPWWLFPHCVGSETDPVGPWVLVLSTDPVGLWVLWAHWVHGHCTKGSLWIFIPSTFSFHEAQNPHPPREQILHLQPQRRRPWVPTDPPAHDQPCTSDGTSVFSGKVC